MTPRALAGTLLAFAYNRVVGRFPSRTLRILFLRGWLAAMGQGSGVQMDCRLERQLPRLRQALRAASSE